MEQSRRRHYPREPPPPEMVLKHADTMKPEDFISRHLRWTRDPMEMRRINQRRAEIYEEVMGEAPDGGAMELLPGVLTFLNLLRQNKVPMAVTCNTYSYSDLCGALKRLGVYEFFEHVPETGELYAGEPHVVSAEDVSDWLPVGTRVTLHLRPRSPTFFSLFRAFAARLDASIGDVERSIGSVQRDALT